MTHNNHSIFLLEHLQPSWHNERKWQWIYLVAARLIAGLMVGIMLWIFYSAGKVYKSTFSVQLFEKLADTLPIPLELSIILTPIILMIMLGLIVASIDGWYFEKVKFHGVKNIPHRHSKKTILIGMIIFIVSFCVVILFDPLIIAVFASTIVVLSFSASSQIVDGTSFDDEIRTVDSIGWSWPHALKGLFPGLLLGLILGWFMSRMLEPILFGVTVFLTVLFFMLINGLQNNTVEKKTYPNQGILLSIKNGLLMLILFSLPTAIPLGLTTKNFQTGLLIGIMFGLIAFLFYGGASLLKHYGLRISLWYRGKLPFRYTEFLDHSARNILLYKVGGGYVFVHRLLQQYFANLPEEDA